MTKRDLSSVRGDVEILRWAKARLAELKELQANARASVEEAMGDADEGVLEDETVITWKTYKKNVVNQAALKEANPDLVEEFREAKEERKFEVLDS